MLYRTFIVALFVALSGCDSPTAERSFPMSVEISPSSTTPFDWIGLRTADELQLRAEVTGSDYTILSDARITWRSSAPQLATVDSTGLVRTAAAYTACGNYSPPFGCVALITATAGGVSDTVAVLVQPRVKLEGTAAITILVGDSLTSLAPPVATVDGEVRCTFFVGPVYPTEILQRSSSGYIIAVGPGQGFVGWLPAHNLCRGMMYSTTINAVHS
jgi:hypothetical protein